MLIQSLVSLPPFLTDILNIVHVHMEIVYVHKLGLCSFLCKRRRSHCSMRRHYHSHDSSL